MMQNSFTIKITDTLININAEYDDTKQYFHPFICKDVDANRTGEHATSITVEEKYWQEMFKHSYQRSAQIEISLLTALVSDVLLGYNKVIIHAVAFSFKGKAWLLCADPGIGKSTQIKYLMDLYPNEFDVICGDRPVLQIDDEGTVFVHPSPWNGKEGWGGAPAAPLEGILLLKRTETTSLRRLKPREAVIQVYRSIISTRETEDIVRKVAELENRLLRSVPVYEYNNGGVPESTEILHGFLQESQDTI